MYVCMYVCMYVGKDVCIFLPAGTLQGESNSQSFLLLLAIFFIVVIGSYSLLFLLLLDLRVYQSQYCVWISLFFDSYCCCWMWEGWFLGGGAQDGHSPSS